MTLLYFITPAYKRYDISQICYAQRKWTQDCLSAVGIEARSVVVADDSNLDIAREFGFDTVEAPNDYLGRKFNVGYRFARKQGATHVMAIGSDSWVSPGYFESELEDCRVVLSRAYSLIDPLGLRRGDMWVGWEGGVAWIAPISMYKHEDPCNDRIMHGCDTATWSRARFPRSRVRESEAPLIQPGKLGLIAFQSSAMQISSYGKLMGQWGLHEISSVIRPSKPTWHGKRGRTSRVLPAYHGDPFEAIEAEYGTLLTGMMRDLYRERRFAARI